MTVVVPQIVCSTLTGSIISISIFGKQNENHAILSSVYCMRWLYAF